jgi:hypothetical protein
MLFPVSYSGKLLACCPQELKFLTWGSYRQAAKANKIPALLEETDVCYSPFKTEEMEAQ